MALHQGYNLVTEPVADTESEMASLEFFRRLAADEEMSTPTTVTGVEDLLYNADEEERGAVLSTLRQTLRSSRSLSPMDAVQFFIDGQFVDDVEFRVRVEGSDGGVYLDIGQMFVEEPKPLTSTHVVARK
jgi:hypothetical protein